MRHLKCKHIKENPQSEFDFKGTGLPSPPEMICGEFVDLSFKMICPGDSRYGFVPFYHFSIQLHDDQVIGHINFKVGSTPHVLFCAGHIGYKIEEPFRGHSYAYHSCKTLAPFIRSIYDSVILTTAPDNYPSIRTIEKLGATYLDLYPIPKEDPNYEKGTRLKCRYEWEPVIEQLSPIC